MSTAEHIWPKSGKYKEPCVNCSGSADYLFPCGDHYCWHCHDNRGRHDECQKCFNAAARTLDAHAELSRIRTRADKLEQLLTNEIGVLRRQGYQHFEGCAETGEHFHILPEKLKSLADKLRSYLLGSEEPTR